MIFNISFEYIIFSFRHDATYLYLAFLYSFLHCITANLFCAFINQVMNVIFKLLKFTFNIRSIKTSYLLCGPRITLFPLCSGLSFISFCTCKPRLSSLSGLSSIAFFPLKKSCIQLICYICHSRI